MCTGERTQPTLAEWHSGSPALAAPDPEKGVMTPLSLPHGELEAWEPALCLECCVYNTVSISQELPKDQWKERPVLGVGMLTKQRWPSACWR